MSSNLDNPRSYITWLNIRHSELTTNSVHQTLDVCKAGFAYVSIYFRICKFTHMCKSVDVNEFTSVQNLVYMQKF